MRTLKQLAALIQENRPALVEAAQGHLVRWANQPKRNDVLYWLVDQTYLDQLLQDVLKFTDAETQRIGESDINCVGEVDIWIDAAKNLGYNDYVKTLEVFKTEGP